MIGVNYIVPTIKPAMDRHHQVIAHAKHIKKASGTKSLQMPCKVPMI